MTMTSGIEVEA